jgi:uncharacterized protein (TIGR03663 family)
VKKNAVYFAVLALIFAAALALRLPGLDRKPMHGDEANQAVRAGMLLDSGVYHYDPSDHHGPVMYFAAMPFCRATASRFADTTEWNYRLVTVFFSVLTILLMTGLGGRAAHGGLFANRAGMAFALLFTAVSPALTYYSRFFIQETMLVCFLTGMFVCGYGYVRSRTEAPFDSLAARLLLRPWLMAALFGMFAGLCAATKETTVLSYAAMFLAALTVFGVRRLLRWWHTRDALIAAGAAAFTAVLFFSSFFTYPKGVHDALFATVEAYLFRATAVPEHQHPWNFYLKSIFWFRYGRGPLWSEAGVLLPAALALLAGWRRDLSAGSGTGRHSLFVRFVFVYTLALTVIYSLIPYKTPWCALSFLHGWILLAGAGFGCAVDFLRRRRAAAARCAGYALLAVSAAALLRFHVGQTLRACGRYAADPRSPYVYAHTGQDAMGLVAAIEKAAAAAQGYETLIAVAVPTPDTWPLPWYLRKYVNVGYWTAVDQIPAGIEPVVIVTAADQGDVAAERFGADLQCNFYGIRPGTLLNLFVPAQSDE